MNPSDGGAGSKELDAHRQSIAGPKVAAIFSVVESCRRLKVPVRDYFSAILPGLADLPISCLPDLTPAVWLARHS
jgi:transposase